jgi:HK97 family phage prohead protease
MNQETRVMPAEEAEIRMSEDGKTLIGYAAVYNRRSLLLNNFVEIIQEGAFDDILNGEHDVIARFNHDPNIVLGRSSSGTLKLYSDSKGLRYEVQLPETRADIAELIRRGDVRGSSFAFSVKRDDQKWDRSVTPQIRSIQKFSGLFDVGPVVTPAYPDTTVAMRSLQEAIEADIKRSNEWLTLRMKIS